MIAQKKREVNPYLPTLRLAHAEGLAVKLTEVCNGRRFRYTTHHPAKRIDGFREERGGTVVVLGMTRVKVRDIVSVEVRAADALVAAVRPVARGERY